MILQDVAEQTKTVHEIEEKIRIDEMVRQILEDVILTLPDDETLHHQDGMDHTHLEEVIDARILEEEINPEDVMHVHPKINKE